MDDYEKFMKNLPVIPEIAVKILGIAEDNTEMSFNDLEEIVKFDPALASKVLKVANSSLYAMQSKISTLDKAISLLGFKTIKSLVLILCAASAFKFEGKLPFYRLFWKNSILTAFVSKELSIELNSKQISEDIFLCGLMHKIGQIGLYRSNSEVYETIASNKYMSIDFLLDVERSNFEIDHRLLGSKILENWKFPQIFIDCAKEYNSKNIVSRYKKEIIIISIANLISYELIDGYPISENELYNHGWLEYLGLDYSSYKVIKDSVMERLNNNQEYKEFEDLFI